MALNLLHSRVVAAMREDKELARFKRQLVGCCRAYSDPVLKDRIEVFLRREPRFEPKLRPLIE